MSSPFALWPCVRKTSFAAAVQGWGAAREARRARRSSTAKVLLNLRAEDAAYLIPSKRALAETRVAA